MIGADTLALGVPRVDVHGFGCHFAVQPGTEVAEPLGKVPVSGPVPRSVQPLLILAPPPAQFGSMKVLARVRKRLPITNYVLV